MELPVLTYDVLLGDSLVGTFTDEVWAGKAVEFIASALKAGAIFQPKDVVLQYVPVSRTASVESVAIAEASGIQIDYDAILNTFEAAQPVVEKPLPPVVAPPVIGEVAP